MLLDKATGANSIVQDKYITISVCSKKSLRTQEATSPAWARISSPILADLVVNAWSWKQMTVCESFTTSTVSEKKLAYHFDLSESRRKRTQL